MTLNRNLNRVTGKKYFNNIANMKKTLFLTLFVMITTIGFAQNLYKAINYTTNKYGFVDKNERTVIDFKYDDILGNFNSGLAAVKLNGRWGFINKNDVMIIPFKYDKVLPFGDNQFYTYVKLGKKWGAIDFNENIVVPFRTSEDRDKDEDCTVGVQLDGVDLSDLSICGDEYYAAKELTEQYSLSGEYNYILQQIANASKGSTVLANRQKKVEPLKADYAEINWQLSNYSTVSNKKININACIKSKSYVEQVTLLVNGESYRGINAVKNEGCDNKINQEISLANGPNTIKIQVKNAAGIKEEERTVNYQSNTPNPQPQGKRYALVIGNSNYSKEPLKNPVNDATDIAAKLRNLNFEVVLITNNSKREMETAINNLATKAKGYDVVMFYYAGHGIQSNNRNYLIPIDVSLAAASDIEYDCVDVNRVLSKMEDAQCNTKILVLDACRNDPFSRSWRRGSGETGLSMMKAPTGTFIAYATDPGNTADDGTGRNSPFTSALLYFLDKKFTIETLFKEVRKNVVEKSRGKQTPWDSSSLIGDFTF